MKNILIVILIIFSFNSNAQNRGIIKFGNNIILNWEIKDFDKSTHTFTYCQRNNRKHLCKIDNQEWYGSDVGTQFPTNSLSELSIEINHAKIKLETSKMYNPNFSGSLTDRQFKLKKNNKNYILFAHFSDGAGSYTVHWRIENGASERILISIDDEDFLWQLD